MPSFSSLPVFNSTRKAKLSFLLVLGLFAQPALAQELQPEYRWDLQPQFSLPRDAETQIGPRVTSPPAAPRWEIETSPGLRLLDQAPTERKRGLCTGRQLASESWTLETWILDHTNQPVGAVMGFLPGSSGEGDHWMLVYANREAWLSFAYADGTEVESIHVELPRRERAFLSWFYHLTAVIRGREVTLYVNGEVAGSQELPRPLQLDETAQFELASYLENEPYMTTGHLVREIRVVPRAWTAEDVQAGFQKVLSRASDGRLVDDQFHFAAGPYLNYATPNSMSLVWETDQLSTAEIRYGTDANMSNTLVVTAPERIHKASLEGLEPGTTYYYQVIARNERGESLDTGRLTFKTAVGPGQPIRFAIFGDTEARPHVNQRVSELVWGERPDFLVNLGDLTDGGMEDEKFQWNYEYFQGMGPLLHRIPTFAVPGNGEGDLYWYNRYHAFPQPIATYDFKYGDAHFFMLDSNRLISPDSDQYQWLEKKLAESDAVWRIVCFHHCAMSSDGDDYGDTWNGEASTFTHPHVAPLIPVFEQYNVDLVFFGHVHCYERSWPLRDGKIDHERGVVYIESGGAGGNLEDFAPTATWFSKRIYRGHHYGVVNVHEGRLTYQMFDTEGRLRDLFEKTKPTSTVEPSP